MINNKAPVVRVQAVSLRYADNLALDDLSLDIPANCMVGLIGPDGVGKSSLMSLLTGARKMQEGRYHRSGRRHRRRRASPRCLSAHCLYAARAG